MKLATAMAAVSLASMGSASACQAVSNSCAVEKTCATEDASATDASAESDEGPSQEASGPDVDAGADGDAGGEGGARRDGDAWDADGGLGDVASDAAADRGDGSDGFKCPTTAEPKDEACVIDESLGVFVSPSGSATGAGTRATPLRSIDAGITLALGEADGGPPKRVYVCGGTFDETIAVDATRDGVQLFGGLRCTDWKYTGERTALAPSSPGIALTLTALTGAMFVDFEVDAQSAPRMPPATTSAAGASSVAVLANGARGVEFRRAKIVAGDAQPGAGGALTPLTFPSLADLQGNAGSGGTGGAAKAFTCPGDLVTLVTTGGKGGNAPAGQGDPGLPALGGGLGGTTLDCLTNTGGQGGMSAGTSVDGDGAATLGVLVTGGVWRPSSGLQGSAGAPGQGGGGGGAIVPGGGGSGGAGGCGGAGGGGGGGGGASVAVIAFDAGLSFTGSTLVSGAGGNGGRGVSGQPGQPQGGNGGLPDSSGGCQGGRGGGGGSGGGGGGGAAGVSVGVLYKGTTPALDTTTISLFEQGLAGSQGPGSVPSTNDGAVGAAGITLASP
jgi:hypothetical protein